MIKPQEYLLNRYPRGKDYTNPILFNCNFPYRVVSIDSMGDCYLCRCDPHLPVSVGNISDFAELSEIWSNPIAQELQKTVDDHSYTYCAVKHCGIINQNQYIENKFGSPQYHISVSIDDSCNLACPSCRRQAINYTDGPVYKRKLAQVNHFVELLNNFTEYMTIILTGNGDPLASLIMRPLILNWTPKEKQNIILFTNGLLMKKLLPDSSVIARIHEFQISVDAGSAEVYEQVRRPGKFEVLQENLSWLSKNRKPNTKVTLKFVLSCANAGDIINFVNMCSEYGFDGDITKIEDWSTFDNFEEQDVAGNPTHKLYLTAIEQLRQAATHPNIHISPILKYLL